MELRPDDGQVADASEWLLERVRRKDEAAMTQLVGAHDGEMVRLCYLVCGDRELARDATQNAWQKLWQSPPRLREGPRLRSWLLSVAANEARQAVRRRAVGRAKEIRAYGSGPMADPLSADLRLDLVSALASLNESERELLALRFVVGLSSAELGAHLGLSAEGARSRVHRAVVRLRAELGDE
ncbi:sigma-70 family RNA polymerase sigma factor [soil metagenome]